MAKELTFTLGGTGYAAAPVKLERKKIYGRCVGTGPRGGAGAHGQEAHRK